jgi:hypothetical protein
MAEPEGYHNVQAHRQLKKEELRSDRLDENGDIGWIKESTTYY